jgi:hypothetical protein
MTIYVRAAQEREQQQRLAAQLAQAAPHSKINDLK